MASGVVGYVQGVMPTMDGALLGEMDSLQQEFLAGFTLELQKQTDRVVDLKELVVKVRHLAPAIAPLPPSVRPRQVSEADGLRKTARFRKTAWWTS
eukprot:9033976-Pyramimonas_sp.AAC.1